MPVANMANPPVQESILFDCSASTCGLVAPGRGLPQGRQPLEQDIEQNYQQPKNASARIWHHHNSLASHSNALNPLSINPLPWNMATWQDLNVTYAKSTTGWLMTLRHLPLNRWKQALVSILKLELIPCFKTHPPQNQMKKATLQHWQPWGASHCQAGSWFAKHKKTRRKKTKKNTQIVHVFVLQPSTSTISSISWHLALIESFEHQLPWEKTEHHHFMQSYNYQGPRPSLWTWTYNVYECVERSTISIDILQ